MTQAIDSQCELACDEEVVRGTGADIRQYYCETIISVIRYQSKRKNSFINLFYKREKRDERKDIFNYGYEEKENRAFHYGGVLILTLGLSFYFVGKGGNKEPPKIIQEDIKEDLSFSYGSFPTHKFIHSMPILVLRFQKMVRSCYTAGRR